MLKIESEDLIDKMSSTKFLQYDYTYLIYSVSSDIDLDLVYPLEMFYVLTLFYIFIFYSYFYLLALTLR